MPSSDGGIHYTKLPARVNHHSIAKGKYSLEERTRTIQLKLQLVGEQRKRKFAYHLQQASQIIRRWLVEQEASQLPDAYTLVAMKEQVADDFISNTLIDDDEIVISPARRESPDKLNRGIVEPRIESTDYVERLVKTETGKQKPKDAAPLTETTLLKDVWMEDAFEEDDDEEYEDEYSSDEDDDILKERQLKNPLEEIVNLITETRESLLTTCFSPKEQTGISLAALAVYLRRSYRATMKGCRNLRRTLRYSQVIKHQMSAAVQEVAKLQLQLEESRRNHSDIIQELSALQNSYDSKIAQLLGEPVADVSAALSKTLLENAKAPDGLVTLIFTDVQNSTYLWEHETENMRCALSLHNNLLRSLIREVGAYEVKTEGDAFMVAFESSYQAVRWCCLVQLELLKVDWPLELLRYADCSKEKDSSGSLLWNGLRVRMGGHTGRPLCQRDPTTRRMDYFGPTVNLSARVGALAKGGQIIVSGALYHGLEAYIDNMEVVCRPMGKHTVKGVKEPVTVFSIVPGQLIGRQFEKSQDRKGGEAQMEAVKESAEKTQQSLADFSNLQMAEVENAISAIKEVTRDSVFVLNYVDKPTWLQERVVLLFMQIENAVSMWDTDHWKAKTVLEVEHAVVNKLVEQYSSKCQIWKNEADFFALMFSRTEEAVLFALAVQTDLLAADWNDSILSMEGLEQIKDGNTVLFRGPKIQIGMHSGFCVAESLDKGSLNITGPLPAKCTKCMRLSKGGEILVTGDFMAELHRTSPPVFLETFSYNFFKSVKFDDDVPVLLHQLFPLSLVGRRSYFPEERGNLQNESLMSHIFMEQQRQNEIQHSLEETSELLTKVIMGEEDDDDMRDEPVSGLDGSISDVKRQDDQDLQERDSTSAAQTYAEEVRQRKMLKKKRKEQKLLSAPKGIVSIVTLDIEDSVSLWEADEKGVRGSIVLIGKLIVSLVKEFQGYVWASEGDAASISFSGSREAILFCLKLQSELLEVDWPKSLLAVPQAKQVYDESGGIIWRGPRVRTAVNTGEPICQPSHTMIMQYYGRDIDVLKQMMKSCRGGEIIVTEFAYVNCKDYLASHEKPLVCFSVPVMLRGWSGPINIFSIVPRNLEERRFVPSVWEDQSGTISGWWKKEEVENVNKNLADISTLLKGAREKIDNIDISQIEAITDEEPPRERTELGSLDVIETDKGKNLQIVQSTYEELITPSVENPDVNDLFPYEESAAPQNPTESSTAIIEEVQQKTSQAGTPPKPKPGKKKGKTKLKAVVTDPNENTRTQSSKSNDAPKPEPTVTFAPLTVDIGRDAETEALDISQRVTTPLSGPSGKELKPKPSMREDRKSMAPDVRKEDVRSRGSQFAAAVQQVAKSTEERIRKDLQAAELESFKVHRAMREFFNLMRKYLLNFTTGGDQKITEEEFYFRWVKALRQLSDDFGGHVYCSAKFTPIQEFQGQQKQSLDTDADDESAAHDCRRLLRSFLGHLAKHFSYVKSFARNMQAKTANINRTRYVPPPKPKRQIRSVSESSVSSGNSKSVHFASEAGDGLQSENENDIVPVQRNDYRFVMPKSEPIAREQPKEKMETKVGESADLNRNQKFRAPRVAVLAQEKQRIQRLQSTNQSSNPLQFPNIDEPVSVKSSISKQIDEPRLMSGSSSQLDESRQSTARTDNVSRGLSEAGSELMGDGFSVTETSLADFSWPRVESLPGLQASPKLTAQSSPFAASASPLARQPFPNRSAFSLQGLMAQDSLSHPLGDSERKSVFTKSFAASGEKLTFSEAMLRTSNSQPTRILSREGLIGSGSSRVAVSRRVIRKK